VRAAGGSDGRASPLLRAAGEGCCEWGFFKLEDRMGERERNDTVFVAVGLAHCAVAHVVWVACGDGEFEAS
jgi:hypothetical protein